MPFVYAFDHKHRKPPMEMKDLLGGKGANLAEMTSVLEPAGAARLHHHHRRLPGLHGGRVARRADRRGGQGHGRRLEKKMGKQLGDPSDPLLVTRAVGGQVLDARDDGHGPQPRPQRRVGRGPGRADRRRALRLRLLPPVHLHVRPHRARHRRRRVRRPSSTRPRSWPASTQRRRDPGRAPALPGRRLQADRRARTPASPSPRIPTSSCAAPSRRCSRSWNGARAVAYRVRERIPHDLGTAVNVQAMVFGNRDDNSGTGVGFTRDPATGATGRVRRLPGQRPGRGRGGRHPQHRAAVGPEGRVPDDPRRAAGHLRPARGATTGTCATPSSPSSRASSGCSRPGSASAPAGPRCAMAVDMTRERGHEDQPGRRRSTGSPPSTSTRCCTPSSPAPATTVLATGLGASPGRRRRPGLLHRRRRRRPPPSGARR